MAQSLSFGNGNKFIFGFDMNGNPLFYDKENNMNTSFIAVNFQSRTYPEIFNYVEFNNKGYLLSTTFEDMMYLINYEYRNYTEFNVTISVQSSHDIFKMENYDDDETYFTDFIYCDKKFDFHDCWINLRLFKFNLTHLDVILDYKYKILLSEKNKIICFQINEKYIQCTYTKKEGEGESLSYNHALSLFSPKTLELEYEEILVKGFDEFCSFEDSIKLRDNVFVQGYSLPDNKNVIKLLIKQLNQKGGKIQYESYIPSVEYININEDNSFSFDKSTSKKNYMMRISDNKFSIILNEYSNIDQDQSYGNKNIVIIICTIYNKNQNIDLRYYKMNFVLYGRKIIDDLKTYTLNNYFGVLLETKFEPKNANQAIFMTFGYVNSTYNGTIDHNLKQNNEKSFIKLNNYISGLENNLFGYKFDGIIIIHLPSKEDAGYFVEKGSGQRVGEKQIVPIDTELKFILSDKYKIGNYTITFAAAIGEPEYDILNKYSDKVETYPKNSGIDPKDYYEPRALLGKEVNYIFSLSCYNTCETCSQLSADPENQKCTKCIQDHFFLKGTQNCYTSLDGHYLDKDTQVFLPCYEKCKRCTGKEENAKKMNCISCYQSYKFYKKSTNCLKCPKYVNYEQTDCIDKVPDGYFIDDEYSGTIGKCHDSCKVCEDYPSIYSTNCLECKYENKKYIKRDEYDCPDEPYEEEGEEEEKKEEEEKEEEIEGECPRDKPIYDGTECSDNYCPSIGTQCVVSNSIVKEQWLNKFGYWGNVEISYVSADTNSKNETFLFAQSTLQGNNDKYLIAFNQYGEGLFTNSTNSNLKYCFKKFEMDENDFIDSIKYVSNMYHYEYLLSTPYKENMYFFDYVPESAKPTKVEFKFNSYSPDTIFPIETHSNAYFTGFIQCQYDDPSDNCYLFFKQFSFGFKTISRIRDKLGDIKVSSRNKLSCLPCGVHHIKCIYTTQEKENEYYKFNHVIAFYDETSLNFIKSVILKENFLVTAFFDSMIDLNSEKNITVIGYTETINSIRVLMKKVGDINSENILTDYIENLPYIDLNTDDLYVFRGATSFHNTLYKINDRKFALLVKNYKNDEGMNGAKGIVIYMFSIYNNHKNINIRHYPIIFKMYNTLVEGDIRCFTLGEFLGIVIELTSSSFPELSKSKAAFLTFGYVNATDDVIDDYFFEGGASQSKIIKVKDYIGGITNNLFGYNYNGIKVLELPDEKESGGYFVNVKNNQKIYVNDIFDNGTEFKFIKNEEIKIKKLFHISFAGMVQEPNYTTMNKFASKIESYPKNSKISEESFYQPKMLMGKKFNYFFTMTPKTCYKNCKTCSDSSDNENDQKCIECKNGFYFMEGTKNCFSEIKYHYYFNKDKKMFSPCYRKCLTCNTKEQDSTHMNCLSCESPSIFYSKSSNCLNCENYVDYTQTKCIDIIEDGYFLLDEEKKIIEKCFYLCKTCNKKGDTEHNNCLTCLYTDKKFKPKYENNCPEQDGSSDEETTEIKSDNGEKPPNDDDENNNWIWILIAIILVLAIVIVAAIIYFKKCKKINPENDDFLKKDGKNISFDDENDINSN